MAKDSKIDEKLLDELLKDRDPQKVFDSDGLLGDLKKALAERILDAEMGHHPDQGAERDAGNHRNGHSRKTVITDSGAMPLSIPRDRQGRFEPQLTEKPAPFSRFRRQDHRVIRPRHDDPRHPGARVRALRHRDLAGSGVDGHRRRSRRGEGVATTAARVDLRHRVLRRTAGEEPR